MLFCKGNQTSSRCHKLEEGLGAPKTEREQIKLKHNEEKTLVAEKRNKENFKVVNARADLVQENELEQVIEKERAEKRQIESRLLSEKKDLERELQEHKEQIVKLIRRNDCLKKKIKKTP